MSRLLLLLLLLLPLSNGQDPCASAPTPALRIICNQIHRWDTSSRAAPTPKPAFAPGMAADGIGLGGAKLAAEFAPIASNMYQCMDIACLCVFFRGTGGSNCVVGSGTPLRKAIRKEYRMLTDDERTRFNAALRTLKSNGEYSRLARIHAQYAESSGAHSGPAFLPWHREFMKRMEIAIRQIDPTLHLPYWDSTLDQNLGVIQDSSMWTNDLMGEVDGGGLLTGGPFRQWSTLEGRANVKREVGKQQGAKFFDDREISSVLSQNNINQVLGYSAPKPGCPVKANFNLLEYTHGNPHISVGGDMFETVTAGNDPIFWMHHSFVDMIWEMYRQNKQSRATRETTYPPDNEQCSSKHHFRDAIMRPFAPLKNIDGLSNMYTDNMYQYAPRPSCAAGPDCGSKFLFCDRSHGAPRCAAKAKVGGKCAGFNAGEPMCYKGVCQGGVCVASGVQTTTQPPIKETRPQVNVLETCFNENQCCAPWTAKGECQRNPGYMNDWCKASCGRCRPNYNLNDECSDRHPQCAAWSRSGECAKNVLWMSENCRKACNKCGQSRASVCGGGGGGGGGGGATTARPVPTIAPPMNQHANPAGCTSPGCYNENDCCPVWARQGQCQANAVWMKCNCKVSCSQCRPPYAHGSCADYHPDCVKWSRSGECGKNRDWMSENCRRSCGTCRTTQQMQAKCNRRRVRMSFLQQLNMM